MQQGRWKNGKTASLRSAAVIGLALLCVLGRPVAAVTQDEGGGGSPQCVAGTQPVEPFTASPATIGELGQSTTLRWNLRVPRGCVMSFWIVEVDQYSSANASLVVTPAAYGTHTYTLKAISGSYSRSWKTTVLVAAPQLLNCAPGSPPFTDVDSDGIIDSCEQTLAEGYAPIVYHSSDESNLPTNVDWFLPKTSLWFYDDECTPDLHSWIITAPTQGQLLGWWYRGGCGASGTVYSNGTRSDGKQRTFYLRDVGEGSRIGSLNTQDWTTYHHAYLNNIGGVTIQYWRFYAYNDAANNHGGDWEGIHLVLDGNFQPARVGFLGHDSIDYQAPSALQWEGTHPRIYSEGGGHASQPSGSGIFARGCLGEPANINPNNPCTFIRQETWTNGQVRWCNNPLVGFCSGSVTSAGSLLNVGAKIAPMNGQVFIQYSGIWGSPGLFYGTSGYWGPAFNETGMRADGFITAWCEGILNIDVQRECYPMARSR